MTQDYAQAWNYVAALTGQNPETVVIDFRALHDTEKGRNGIPYRGTLPHLWNSLIELQSQGYGIFCCVNAMDGDGRKYENIAYIRAQVADLDNVSAPINAERAFAWSPAPQFYVQSSPGKFHLYWGVDPYTGDDYYRNLQRKIRQVFDGDKSVIDPTRVLRLPGTFHLKRPETPTLVTFHPLPSIGQRYAVRALEAALAHVNLIDAHSSDRFPLGHPDKAAPSVEWLWRAMQLLDPNHLERQEWLAITAAIKQAGWSITDGAYLRQLWDIWCAQYNTLNVNGEPVTNDPAENDKLWNSISDSETGWTTLLKRAPGLEAEYRFSGVTVQQPVTHITTVIDDEGNPQLSIVRPTFDSPFLDGSDQSKLFGDCVFVTTLGQILEKSTATFMGSTAFNGEFGGHRFILDDAGEKVTDEAWKAATRSTTWTVPKVHHTRFLPTKKYGDIIVDEMGRKGVNVYQPFNLISKEGDVSFFLRHMEIMLPDPTDRKILLDYLAHNIKFPGHKIPWAPFIQSTEGVGKGILAKIMGYCMGPMYVYRPKAKQLGDSGAKFNAWMRNKLFLIADEVKCDDQRELIEILKPMISEDQLEMEAKGENQKLEDNFSNWLFFSNYTYAIPIGRNNRRFAPFFTQLQHVSDLVKFGLTDDYFNQYIEWLKKGGYAAIAHYFLNYPIERGELPTRAPRTSSTEDAIRLSRGPIERVITEAIDDGLQGFRGGWVSVIATIKRVKAAGLRQPSAQQCESILGEMGYFNIGRAPRMYIQEDNQARSQIFHMDRSAADIEQFGRAQGYE